MNSYAIRAIYHFEMARWFRTLVQSVLSPVISTSLYFVVFGAAIGSRMAQIDGVSYGAFIVPGLIMLSVLTESISNASFGIYMPRWAGTIYEVLSAPISYIEIVHRLRRRGGDQVDPARPDHPRDRAAVRAVQHRASALDGRVPGADLGHVQPVRLHHRPVGERLGEAADRADHDHHAAGVPRRQLLLDQHAAAVLAEGHAVQSGRVPDQRLPLELLRHLRRQRRREPRHDVRCS